MLEFTPYIDRILTALAMPVGLLWIFLFVLYLLVRRSKQQFAATVLLLTWVALTFAGSNYGSSFIAGYLEREYRDIKPLEEGPFDAVVVLGGGTSKTPAGSAQLATAGDRVAMGARLYHAGITPVLVASGGERYQFAGDAAEIWKQLKVPEEAIIKISGRNTTAEIRSLAAFVEKHGWEDKRIGLVTSATHMPRALRLAGENNLTLEPLPADFTGWRRLRLRLENVLPSASGLYRTEKAAKEMLARLVGR